MATDSGKKLFVARDSAHPSAAWPVADPDREGLGFPELYQPDRAEPAAVTAPDIAPPAETYDLDLRDLATADEDRFLPS